MVVELVRDRPAGAPGGPRAPRARRAALVVLGAAGGLLLVAAFVAILSPDSAFGVTPSLTSQYRMPPVLLLMAAGAAALVAVAVLGRRTAARSAAPSGRLRAAAWWGFVAACLTGQLLLAHAVLQLPSWDAAQIFEVAYHLAVAPEPRLFPIGDQAAYFALYPNNAFLVAVLACFFGVLRAAGLSGMEQFLWASVVLNCVALTGALVLARAVVRRLAPGIATATTAVLGLLLVGVSPWLNVVYSDSLAMAFPIGMLAIWLTWPRHRSTRARLVLFALLGALAAVGYAIKPPVVFMALALLLVTVRPGLSPRTWFTRRSLATAGSLAGGMVVTEVVVTVATHLVFPGFGAVQAMPFTHFMAMGATGDGGFNAADFDRSFALPAGARAKSDLFLWIDRVEAMGPLGYPLFLAQKMLYALSDGSFFQYREGAVPFSTAYFATDPASRAVQSVFDLGAPLHWVLASVWQAAWWSAVLLCLVPLRRLALPRSGAVAAMRIALALLLAFLCLSESRSRYLYHYLPVVLVLAGLGSAALVAEVRFLVDRRARSDSRAAEQYPGAPTA